MSDLIGSWKAKTNIYTDLNSSAFNLPAGAIISVTRFDSDSDKVLVEFGPRDIGWKHNNFLGNFEKLD